MAPTNACLPKPGLVDLPIEIKKIIIQESKSVAQDEDGDWELEIQTLSLVSKRLAAPCQEFLFEVIDMEPPKFRFGKEIWAGSDTLSRFPTLMKSSPHLGQFIRRLIITFPLNPDAKISVELANEIVNALEKITHLTGLSLQHEDETYCKAWSISIPDMRASPKLGRLSAAVSGLFGANLQHLLLRNVTIPVGDLMRCTSLEGFHLLNADLTGEIDRTSDVEEFLEGKSIYLKTLEVNGKTSFPSFLTRDISGRRLPIYFSALGDLTIPLWSADGAHKQLPDLVLPQTQKLRSLYLHAADPYALSPDDDGLDRNALVHLNPGSYTSLTHLTLSIEFDITDPDTVIQHPYLGFFSDGTMEELIALECLEVEVWIGGAEARNICVDESCGPQWGALDAALVSAAEQGRGRLSMLEEVSVLIGMVEDEPDIHPDDIFDMIKRRVFRTQFPRLTELDRRGDLALVLQTEVRFRRF